jgi:tetratricopeptide (TPR) repeat protein
MLMHPLIALALLAAPNAGPAPDPDQAQVDRASDLISASKPADAIALLEPLIAAQDKAASTDHRKRYCARSAKEIILYTGLAARRKTPAVVLPQSACYSVFLKGFALIDLDRSDEAKGYLDKAIALAPSNAHFLGELAEWYKGRKVWSTSRALFQRAVDAAVFSPDDRQVFDKTRGLRGLAYILIQDGKLDEAEKLYRQCLQMNPNDDRSKSQLEYIASQRSKKS